MPICNQQKKRQYRPPCRLFQCFRNFTSLPYKIVRRLTFFEKFDAVFYQETMLSSGVFRRETARGFYPRGKVDSPRKRVAEGLCGWRHGNSFPMAQNAQSHRQMRSIPHCPKAVFYVFVFHSIHNSAIKLIIAPLFFPLNRFIPGRGWRGCQRAGWRFRACRWQSRCW